MKEFNPLHHKLPDLQNSYEVRDAVDKQKRLTGEKVSNTPEAKLSAYMSRLEKIYLNKDESTRKRNLEMMRESLYDMFIIKKEDVPESYFELQKRVARERGQIIENIDERIREQMVSVIIEDQKKSLDAWIDYLSSNDAMYPTWFKYFVFRNIVKLSQFDKELGKFKERTKATTAPFPDIYREALATIADLYESASRDTILFNDTDFQTFLSKKFGTQYANAIQKTLEHSQEEREQIQGTWVKYKQGDEESAKKLYQSLENKGTGWCTAGYSTAKAQIESGDFYVFYSYDARGMPTNPRLAIRMEEDHIGEVRGILQHQEVEPLLQEVLDEKLSSFGSEADSYKKKSLDMKRLTSIKKKSLDSYESGVEVVLTRDELFFLYEVYAPIEGFGYERDPRIDEIQKDRNRDEDIVVMCNCEQTHIAKDFLDINEHTLVYCEVNWKHFTFVDFREEKNKAKLSLLIELAQVLRSAGSPARPDMSFEGGIISLEIDKVTQESLRTWNTAKVAYENADNKSPSLIWGGLNNIPYLPPHGSSLAVIVLNNGATTSKERDKLVEDMDKAGYRPLEFSELVALGIIKPEHNKRSKVLNTYKKYSLDGRALVPCLSWRGGERVLDANWSDSGWVGGNRFLFVRK
jgi:hypothetical protein